jgi:putative transcriptional regulator
VREFGSSLSLAGSLLIAHPGLLDPNFRKTVLFLSSHDEEDGCFGVVLNRPADRTVSDLLPDRDMGALGRVPVFIGGPVGRDQLIFASFEWDPITEKMECQHHIGLDEAQQMLGTPNTKIMAFVGYAGWSKGQLEGELEQKAWLLKKPDQSVLDLKRVPQLWRDLIATFGAWFQLAAESPDDPSRN